MVRVREAKELDDDEDEGLMQVKLYSYVDSEWLMEGLGQVQPDSLLANQELEVLTEGDEPQVIHLSKVPECNGFQRQGEKVIVWYGAGTKQWAISFQMAGGCTDIWEMICAIKEMDPNAVSNNDDAWGEEEQNEVDVESHGDARPDEERFEQEEQKFDLPSMELSNLEEIERLVKEAAETRREAQNKMDKDLREMAKYKCEAVCKQVSENGYFERMLELFAMCEDLSDEDSLKRLYSIMLWLVMTAEAQMYELMFQEEHLDRVIGVLEYDPSLPEKAEYRDNLENTIKFKQVIPLPEGTLDLVHKTFRVMYFKDVVLSKVTDETVLGTLSTYVTFSGVDIVERLQEDGTFPKQLVECLQSNHDGEDYKNSIALLKEFCNMAKSLQLVQKEALYKTLIHHGMLKILGSWLDADSAKLRREGMQILLGMLSQHTFLIRKSILSAKKGNEEHLLKVLVRAFGKETNRGNLMQLMGIIRRILSTDDMDSKQNVEKTNLLSMFYSDCMDDLIAPLFQDQFPTIRENLVDHERLYHILGFLSFVIPPHSYHSKNYVLSKSILRRLTAVMTAQESKVLVLGACRVVGTIVGMKNEFYFRNMVKSGVFQPMIQALLANENKLNLVYSCILEILENIRSGNIKLLVTHIAETYGKQLENFKTSSVPADLILRHQKNIVKTYHLMLLGVLITNFQNPEEEVSDKEGEDDKRDPNRYRRDTGMDEEEENYWDDETEEAGPATEIQPPSDLPSFPSEKAPTFKRRLVDYDDEDDDDCVFPSAIQPKKRQLTFKTNFSQATS
eukprot:m.103589 g.103589  ORF g.103589 m.103589 type:complete len:789 (+) comp13816_c0_seq2:326-2692(+)